MAQNGVGNILYMPVDGKLQAVQIVQHQGMTVGQTGSNRNYSCLDAGTCGHGPPRPKFNTCCGWFNGTAVLLEDSNIWPICQN